MKKKSVVITGATGVIGMALVEKCIEEGIKVYVLVNPSSSRIGQLDGLVIRENLFGDACYLDSPEDERLTIIKCGLDDFADATPESLGIPAGQADCFYHLAWGGTYGDARNDVKFQEKNVQYTLDAVRLANRLGCSCFIGVGSQAEYGRVESVKLSSDTPTNPENEYGKAKLKAGISSRSLCKELGIRHIWTRVLSIYGPFDGPNTLITSTIGKIINGERPALTAGEQVWDYLYSKDAAKALLMLGESGLDGQVYPIGSGKTRLLKEYLEVLRDNINPSVELGLGDIPYFDKQVMYLCADISNLEKDTGFTPSYEFEEGIRETISWFKSTQVR